MFPVSTLLPTAISAATSIAGQLANNAMGGLSFARVLADNTAPQTSADSVSQSAPHGSGSSDFDTEHSAAMHSLEAACQSLEPLLTERLQQAGVDLSEPVVLELDQFGHLLETSGHLDRDKIERLFESDPELAQSVRQLLYQAEQLGSTSQTDTADQRSTTAQLVLTGRQVQLRFSPDRTSFSA